MDANGNSSNVISQKISHLELIIMDHGVMFMGRSIKNIEPKLDSQRSLFLPNGNDVAGTKSFYAKIKSYLNILSSRKGMERNTYLNLIASEENYSFLFRAQK